MVFNSGRSRTGGVLVAAAVLLAVSSAAHGQTVSMQSQASQIGFTGGLSIDPEQGFVGVFWRSPEIANRFHLRPGIDGGFGSDLRLATINLDFIARFPLGASGWYLVQGGGPTVVVARLNTPRGVPSARDVSAGGSYVLGFAHDNGVLAEFRIGGGGGVPSLKIGAGFAFGF